jgi:hypothetical protein
VGFSGLLLAIAFAIAFYGLVSSIIRLRISADTDKKKAELKEEIEQIKRQGMSDAEMDRLVYGPDSATDRMPSSDSGRGGR